MEKNLQKTAPVDAVEMSYLALSWCHQMRCTISNTGFPSFLGKKSILLELEQKTLTLTKPFSHLLRMNFAESIHNFQLGFFDSQYLRNCFCFWTEEEERRRIYCHMPDTAKHFMHQTWERESERNRDREFHQICIHLPTLVAFTGFQFPAYCFHG